MSNKILKYIPYLILVTILILNLILYFAHLFPQNNLADGILRDTFFNSDALYLPTLYKDIVDNHQPYSNWYLTPTPYFFPDMFLYFISNFITQNYYYAIPLFFTFENIFLFFIIYKINSIYTNKEFSLYTTSFIMMLIYLFPLKVYILQYVSGFHYGEFLAGLIVLYFTIQYLIKKNFSFKELLIFLLISSITLASDKLLLLHYLIPITLSMIILAVVKIIKLKKLLKYIGYVSLIYFLGSFLHNKLIPHKVIFPNVASPKLEFSMISHNLPYLKDIFVDAYHTSPFITLLIIISITLSIIFSIEGLLKVVKQEKLKFNKYLYFFLFFISIQAMLNILAVAMTTHEVSPRHMIPLFILPLFALPIIIYNLNSKKIKNTYYIRYPIYLTFTFLLFSQFNKFYNIKLKSNYLTPMAKCFNNFIQYKNIEFGIGHYWHSKQLSLLSNINIAQVKGDLKPYQWISTDSWYKKQYNFAIIDHTTQSRWYRLNRDKIIKINGEPDSIQWCGKNEILYYKNGLKLD